MKKYIDLHIHTTCSDGKYTPLEIAEQAIANRLGIISITDHNTVDGVKDMKTLNLNLQVIPGIELTAFHNTERHILGYFSNDVSEGIETFFEKKRASFAKEFTKCYKELVKKGYKISKKDMMANGRYSATKLCQSMLEKGYVNTEEEAYVLAFGYGRNEYKCLWQATPKECIELVNGLGGCAVLAHPGHYLTKVCEDEIVEYIECGLKGIECYHPNHTQHEVVQYLDICKRHNLLVTGGSDFHGDFAHPQRLGAQNVEKNFCQSFLSFINSL